jgi:uncharacterized protein YecT (DUF1311 family)
MKSRALVIVPLLLCATGVVAEEKIDCKHTTVQPDLNECAFDDFQKADAILKKVYAGAMQRLERGDADRLRDAQREWVKFRDAECLYRAGGPESLGIGASMGPMVEYDCEEELTKQRIEQLHKDANYP